MPLVTDLRRRSYHRRCSVTMSAAGLPARSRYPREVVAEPILPWVQGPTSSLLVSLATAERALLLQPCSILKLSWSSVSYQPVRK